MKNYSFTIVIPVYNAEKYIEEMLDSVFKQTYSNWNLIIVDDGSTDRSGIICDKYTSHNIEVLHFSNQGQVKARVEGIKRATGDYTLVLDADDKLDLNCLEKVNRVLNKKQYDAVLYNYAFCDENLNYFGESSTAPKCLGELKKIDVLHWVISTWSHGLVSKAIKTEIIKKGVADVPLQRLKINGDYELIIPILCQVDSAYFLEENLYFYRVYDLSISHNYSFQQVLDTDFVSIFVENCLKNNNLYTEQLREDVNVAYLRMVDMITSEIVKKGAFGYDNYWNLKNQQFYRNSISYEKMRYLGIKCFVKMWTLRNSFALFIPLIKLFSFIKMVKGII